MGYQPYLEKKHGASYTHISGYSIHSVRELGLRLVTNSILQDLEGFVFQDLCDDMIFRGPQGGINLKKMHWCGPHQLYY